MLATSMRAPMERRMPKFLVINFHILNRPPPRGGEAGEVGKWKSEPAL
jgi:hypothetical protein